MQYYTDREIVYVNSRNRLSGTDSNFQYKIELNNNVNYDHVVVLDASIPKSSYTIQNNNNTFTVTEEINGSSTNRIITIPEGNYTRQSLSKVLKTLLNDNVNTYVYNITYDNVNNVGDTGKYTYTWSNVNGTAQEVIFTFGDNLWEQLGFNKNSINTFVNGTLISTSVINLRPEGTYFILSSMTNNDSSVNILQNIISYGSDDFNYIIFNNPNPEDYSKKLINTKSNTYNFIITDENFHELQLNGINIVFTLMFYKKNNLSRLFTAWMKWNVLQLQNN